jgi:hypothetical protein
MHDGSKEERGRHGKLRKKQNKLKNGEEEVAVVRAGRHGGARKKQNKQQNKEQPEEPEKQE